MQQSHLAAQERVYLARSACPCCGAPQSMASPAVHSTPAAEALPPEQHSGFMSGYKSQRVFFSYFRCGTCGLLYCPVFYNHDQLLTHYKHQLENMAGVPRAARSRTQEGYARLLIRHSRGCGGFFEVGPDIGLFAEACARTGNFSHFWLYEPNVNVHSELAARFESRPHTIRASMVPTEEIVPGSVSAAALIHVLDHLLDPVDYLAELGKKLESDGILLIVAHNSSSLLARGLGRRWPPFALQHPQLYTPKSIAALLQRTGFAVLEMAAATNHFPLMHLVRAGFEVLGVPGIAPGAQGPILPIRLGNMVVIARKRA